MDRSEVYRVLERQLQKAVQPFDYTHEPKSKENTVGDTPLR